MLLEPIMSIEVVTPEEFMGDVIGDLNARRGKVVGMEPKSGAQHIQGQVPLATMFGYATDLRCRTPGQGDVHDAVQPLRGRAEAGRGRDHRPHPRTLNAEAAASSPVGS